jgi:hypothetical protein
MLVLLVDGVKVLAGSVFAFCSGVLGLRGSGASAAKRSCSSFMVLLGAVARFLLVDLTFASLFALLQMQRQFRTRRSAHRGLHCLPGSVVEISRM